MNNIQYDYMCHIGVKGAMDIVVGNEHGNPSSNLGRGC